MSDEPIKRKEREFTAEPEPEPASVPQQSLKKVTAPPSKKVKNPKRVEAGKKLAARNKERLARIKEFEEVQKKAETSASLPSDDQSTIASNNQVLVGVGGVSLALLVGYIGYQKLTSPQPEPQKSKQSEVKHSVEAQRDERSGCSASCASEPKKLEAFSMISRLIKERCRKKEYIRTR